MSKELTENKIMKALDWAYDKALDNNLPGLESAFDLANHYNKNDRSLDKNINSLVRWQKAKCATSGFISGIGGLLTLPVAVPANIASVLYVQIRMLAAIAIMGGYDVKDDRVKTLVYLCLCGSAANEILRKAGIEVGKKLAVNALKKIPGAVIVKINQKVGFRLVTKFGEKGVINLGKMIPLLGGLIGATFDTVSTTGISKIAKKIFIENKGGLDCEIKAPIARKIKPNSNAQPTP